MLYLSIALIAAGVLFILYSLFSSKKASPASRAVGSSPVGVLPDEPAPEQRPFRSPSGDELDEPAVPLGERHPADARLRSRGGADQDADARALHEGRPVAVDPATVDAGSGDGSAPPPLAGQRTEAPGGARPDEIVWGEGGVRIADDGTAPDALKGADEPASGADDAAVLFEDASNIIDYYSGENTIDSSLAAYSRIRRIGRGTLEHSRDGINFFMGKKFYRFDFYRVTDVRAGAGYLALSMKDSDMVRLFIFERESQLAAGIAVQYTEYIKGKL